MNISSKRLNNNKDQSIHVGTFKSLEFHINKQPVHFPKDSVVHFLEILKIPLYLMKIVIDCRHLAPHVSLNGKCKLESRLSNFPDRH